MSSKIEDLDLCCQDAARKTLDALNADSELKNSGVAGWLVIETLRPIQSQIAYASRLMASYVEQKYRSVALDFVKACYKLANLQAPPDGECFKPITWTMRSKHLDGLAMDIAPLKADGKVWWDAPMHIWMRMATIAESYGWEAGVRWPDDQQDSPHLQWREK